MSRENGRPAPPLYVWIITFMVFCSFLICWFPKYREYTLINLDSGRLEKFSQIPRSDSVTKIVIIGTSVTARGILFDEAFEQLARVNGYGNYKVLRFTRQSASLYDFYFLFDKVLASNPDKILIQSSLVLYRTSQLTRLKYFYEDYTNSLRRAMSQKWDSIPSIKMYNRDNQNLQAYLEGMPEVQLDKKISPNLTKDALDRKINERKSWKLETVPFSGRFGNFLKKARDRGIDVIFLDIPVSEDFDPYLPGTKSQRDEMMLQYVRQYGVLRIRWEDRMPRENFSDFVHMTISNKIKYSDWLLHQLQMMRSKSAVK